MQVRRAAGLIPSGRHLTERLPPQHQSPARPNPRRQHAQRPAFSRFSCSGKGASIDQPAVRQRQGVHRAWRGRLRHRVPHHGRRVLLGGRPGRRQRRTGHRPPRPHRGARLSRRPHPPGVPVDAGGRGDVLPARGQFVGRAPRDSAHPPQRRTGRRTPGSRVSVTTSRSTQKVAGRPPTTWTRSAPASRFSSNAATATPPPATTGRWSWPGSPTRRRTRPARSTGGTRAGGSTGC